MTPKNLVREDLLLQLKNNKAKPLDWPDRHIQYFKTVQTVSLYMPIAGEVRTQELSNILTSHGIKVLYPVTDQKDMRMLPPSQLGFEMLNGFMQPKYNDLSHVEVPDVVICPLVAICKDGYRLGRGFGHYDRYLQKHKTISYGLAYHWQEVDVLNIDVWDHRLNGCFFVQSDGSIVFKEYL